MAEPVNTFIKPTVGRVVWFWPKGQIPKGFTLMQLLRSFDPTNSPPPQPCVALICFVHNDGLVNLAVMDHIGQGWALEKIPLLQEGQAAPAVSYCEWMPFQKGQAKAQDAGK